MGDSRRKYEEMREEYVDKEAMELCGQIEKQLERIITFDNGMLDDRTFNDIKRQAIKLLKEWHL
tara:strand:- start:1064 stop:1255 length:192 start_codon:yes stop_codon:yes gene_type:complete